MAPSVLGQRNQRKHALESDRTKEKGTKNWWRGNDQKATYAWGLSYKQHLVSMVKELMNEARHQYEAKLTTAKSNSVTQKSDLEGKVNRRKLINQGFDPVSLCEGWNLK